MQRNPRPVVAMASVAVVLLALVRIALLVPNVCAFAPATKFILDAPRYFGGETCSACSAARSTTAERRLRPRCCAQTSSMAGGSNAGVGSNGPVVTPPLKVRSKTVRLLVTPAHAYISSHMHVLTCLHLSCKFTSNGIWSPDRYGVL